MKTTRYHTRAIGLVHSHVEAQPDKGEIHISADIQSISTTKSVKGAGVCTIELLPRRNYMNLVFPNDIVNIYFDTGEGKGFIRTYLGWIDRVRRLEDVDPRTGSVRVRYQLHCTDITKPFDRTDIYFNPHLNNRRDLIDPRFGMSLLGGHALRTRGVTAHGTPATMIENMASMFLGFGAQWDLPKSYVRSAGRGLQFNREIRQARSKSRIPEDVIVALSEQTDGQVNKENLDAVLLSDIDVDALLLAKIQERQEAIFIQGIGAGDTQEAFKQAAIAAQKSALAKYIEGNAALKAYKTILLESTNTAPYTALDLIDLSFIETFGIDGYIASKAIWTKQGSLMRIMNGYSNEIVNELMFDLRPVVDYKRYNSSVFGHEYSTEEDELGINANGVDGNNGRFKATHSAVKYVPAIVMREYPYSTSVGLDLSQTFISTEPGGALGYMAFGPIFAQSPKFTDRPCRVLWDYASDPGLAGQRGLINPEACTNLDEENRVPAQKHLDVFPIRDTDIVKMDIGRSDHDVFNLFAVYATDSLQKIYKYLLQDILPIITPVSIARNGLRVREVQTKFANFSRDALCDSNKTQSSGIDNAAIRKHITRWALLMDHWNQHNHEYLSGTITLRGMPDLRVGYRLDLVDRNESYYVEQVSHNWRYNLPMKTQIQVSRGQRNDPYPAYIPPEVATDFGSGFTFVKPELSKIGGGNRQEDGRLGQYFKLKNVTSTQRSTLAPESEFQDLDENTLDISPNADFGKRAEYSVQIQRLPKLETYARQLNAILTPASWSGRMSAASLKGLSDAVNSLFNTGN